jgi:tetratricopeptide (TPR) repeat protein
MEKKLKVKRVVKPSNGEGPDETKLPPVKTKDPVDEEEDVEAEVVEEPDDSKAKAEGASEDMDEVHLTVEADLLLLEGGIEKAVTLYLKATEINPDYEIAWNNLGVAYAKLNKFTSAIKYYDKALEINPGYGRAWFNKGKAFHKLGKLDSALTCYNKAIKIEPENISALNNKGVVLRELGNLDEAIGVYNTIISRKKDYPYAWHNKGFLLQMQGKHKDAIECFNKALELKPDMEEAMRHKKMSQKATKKGL